MIQISANNYVRLSYGELHSKAVRAAQNIKKLNLMKGDVVAVIAKNNHDLIPILVALLSLNYPINTLNPTFTEEVFMHMLDITKPKLIFCEVESYETVRRYLRQLKNEAKIYTFCGRIGDAFAVDDLFCETGEETEFM